MELDCPTDSAGQVGQARRATADDRHAGGGQRCSLFESVGVFVADVAARLSALAYGAPLLPSVASRRHVEEAS